MASGGGFARVHMSNDNNVDMGLLLPHPSDLSFVLNSEWALGKGWETEKRLSPMEAAAAGRGEGKQDQNCRHEQQDHNTALATQRQVFQPPARTRNYVWIPSKNKLSFHFGHEICG